jgi:hypothetical protein
LDGIFGAGTAPDPAPAAAPAPAPAAPAPAPAAPAPFLPPKKLGTPKLGSLGSPKREGLEAKPFECDPFEGVEPLEAEAECDPGADPFEGAEWLVVFVYFVKEKSLFSIHIPCANPNAPQG